MLCGRIYDILSAFSEDFKKVPANREEILYLEERGLIECIVPDENSAYQRKLAEYEYIEQDIEKYKKSVAEMDPQIEKLEEKINSTTNKISSVLGFSDDRGEQKYEQLKISRDKKQQKIAELEEELKPLHAIKDKYAGFKKTDTDMLIRGKCCEDITEYLGENLDRLRRQEFDYAYNIFMIDRKFAKHVRRQHYGVAVDVLSKLKDVDPFDLKLTLSANLEYDSNHDSVIDFLKSLEEKVFKDVKGKFFDFLLDKYKEEADHKGMIALQKNFPHRVSEFEYDEMLPGILEENVEEEDWDGLKENVKQYNKEIPRKVLVDILENIAENIELDSDDFFELLKIGREYVLTEGTPYSSILNTLTEQENWSDVATFLEKMPGSADEEIVETAVISRIENNLSEEDLEEAENDVEKFHRYISAKELASCIESNLNIGLDDDDKISFLEKAAKLKFQDYEETPFDWIVEGLLDEGDDEEESAMRYVKAFPRLISEDKKKDAAKAIFGKKINENEFDEAKDIYKKHNELLEEDYFRILEENLGQDEWPDPEDLIGFIKNTAPEAEDAPLAFIAEHYIDEEEDDSALDMIKAFPALISDKIRQNIGETVFGIAISNNNFEHAKEIYKKHKADIEKKYFSVLQEKLGEDEWPDDEDLEQLIDMLKKTAPKCNDTPLSSLVEYYTDNEDYDSALRVVEEFPELIDENQKTNAVECKLRNLIQEAEFEDAVKIMNKHGDCVGNMRGLLNDTFFEGGTPSLEDDTIDLLKFCAKRYFDAGTNAFDFIVEGYIEADEHNTALQILEEFPEYIGENKQHEILENKLSSLIGEAEFSDALEILKKYDVKNMKEIFTEKFTDGGTPSVDDNTRGLLRFLSDRYFSRETGIYDFIVEAYMDNDELDEAGEIVELFPNNVSKDMKKTLKVAMAEQEDE